MKKALPLILAYLLWHTCAAQYMYTNLTNDIQVNSMAQDGPSLWFATTGGVFKYDTLTGNVQRFDITNSPIFYDDYSSVKVAGNGQKVFIPAGLTMQIYNDITGWAEATALGNDDYPDAVGDNLGRLWLAGEDELYFFYSGQWHYLTTIAGFSLPSAGTWTRPYCAVDLNTNTAWIYYYDLNEVLECDSNNNWSAHVMPAHQSNALRDSHTNLQNNYIYGHNSDFYLLNQPGGNGGAPAFLKMSGNTWTAVSCPLITLGNDYLINMQFMGDSSIRIAHGNLNEELGEYNFGTYVYSHNVWTEENHITGTVPFQKDSATFNYSFVAADASGNIYYAYGYDGNQISDQVHSSGLWKLSPNNHWTKVNIGNVNFKSNYGDASFFMMDTTSTVYIYNYYSKGLDKFLPDNSVTHTHIPPCLSSLYIRGCAMDSSANLWVCGSITDSVTGILQNGYIINQTNCSVYATPGKDFYGLNYYQGKFYTVASDTSKNIYEACFSNGNFTFTPITLPASGYDYWFLNFYVHDTLTYGLVNLDRTSNFNYQVFDNTNLLYQRINGVWTPAFPFGTSTTNLIFDTLGRPWVCNNVYDSSYNRGPTMVYMFDGTTWIRSGSTFQGVPSAGLAVDANNLITLSTSAGMFQFNGTSWTSFPGFEGNSGVGMSIWPRKDGTIFMATG